MYIYIYILYIDYPYIYILKTNTRLDFKVPYHHVQSLHHKSGHASQPGTHCLGTNLDFVQGAQPRGQYHANVERGTSGVYNDYTLW